MALELQYRMAINFQVDRRQLGFPARAPLFLPHFSKELQSFVVK